MGTELRDASRLLAEAKVREQARLHPVLMDGSPTQPDDLRSLIGQAIGAGSVCWSGDPQGTFDSVRAQVILVEVLDWIMAHMEPADAVVDYPPTLPAAAIDVDYISRQVEFSRETFGPGTREAGVCDHIRKELVEIQEAVSPEDKLAEWVDVIILAIDGAWRIGAEPEQIIAAVHAKLARNMMRTWPDWRTAPEGKAIEHDRTVEEVKNG